MMIFSWIGTYESQKSPDIIRVCRMETRENPNPDKGMGVTPFHDPWVTFSQKVSKSCSKSVVFTRTFEGVIFGNFQGF